jgi:hypothetical protein
MHRGSTSEGGAVTTDRAADIGLAEALGRQSEAIDAIWRPRRIGPRFRWLDHDTIKLVDGKLAGREFGLTTDIQQRLRNSS